MAYCGVLCAAIHSPKLRRERIGSDVNAGIMCATMSREWPLQSERVGLRREEREQGRKLVNLIPVLVKVKCLILLQEVSYRVSRF